MSSSPATDTKTPPSPAAAAAVASKKEIIVTENAAQEIARQREKRGTPNARIRVGVRGGGCTGFTYVFEWADSVKPTDKEFKAEGHDIGIVVDPKSLVYLGGMTLDFVRGMMGHGFKFNNPNAKGSCGCGESVQF
ncbi:MAG TPA: iron-sulfur cluster assembly accessory protein [Kofleriaceae bacterium]|nr:iron-sulfur cluster assembly accessory protein [Kofleriaceae bacterium]